MPLPDLTPEEYAEIVRLVRAAIDGDRYVLSLRVHRLRARRMRAGNRVYVSVLFLVALRYMHWIHSTSVGRHRGAGR